MPGAFYLSRTFDFGVDIPPEFLGIHVHGICIVLHFAILLNSHPVRPSPRRTGLSLSKSCIWD